jgi:hypothetical protein
LLNSINPQRFHLTKSTLSTEALLISPSFDDDDADDHNDNGREKVEALKPEEEDRGE